MIFPSKKEFDEKRKFTLLPPDDYKLRVIKVEEDTQQKYKAEKGEMEDVINITFEVISYKDGKESMDEDGKPSAGRNVFLTGRPESMGFQQDGTPAKLRSLVAYALGQDVYEEVQLQSWEELLGKEVDAEIIKKPNNAGDQKNRIGRFIAPRGQRPAPAGTDSVGAVEVKDEEDDEVEGS